MVTGVKKILYRTYQYGYKVALSVLDWSEPYTLTGAGSIKRLPAFVKEKGVRKVLVITDEGLSKLHLLDSLFENLDKEGVEFILYDKVQANPTIPNVETAFQMYQGYGCDGIIAFGGGSPMDCAKATAARLARRNKPLHKMRGQMKVMRPIPPLFVVPTTAGTGSETTVAAVVTDPETHEKYAINDPFLKPKYAVMDPELTIGLPKSITAGTGMDALTHAVEAYTNVFGTKSTNAYAEKAVELVFDNLIKAYDDGKNMEARENMLMGSFYGGMAFTRAFVGNIHAIAHNLGGLYGAPHGFANAIILPHMLDYYGSTIYKKLAKLAEFAGVGDANMSTEIRAKAFIQAIRDMNAYMEIPEKFDCILEKDIPIIVERALKEANPLYPVPKIMDKEDCTNFVRSLMA